MTVLLLAFAIGCQFGTLWMQGAAIDSHRRHDRTGEMLGFIATTICVVAALGFAFAAGMISG